MYVIDISGRTDFFSEKVAKALNADYVSCGGVMGNAIAYKVYRFLLYAKNLFHLIFLLLRNKQMYYNIPKFFVLEALIFRAFGGGRTTLIVHNKYLHHQCNDSWQVRFFYRSFRRFMVHDPEVERFLRHVVKNGNVLIHPLPSFYSIPPNGLPDVQSVGGWKVGFVGQLRKQKGADLLLQWIDELKDPNDGLKIVILGESIDVVVPDGVRLRSDVELHDYYLSEEELISYAASTDVFILPYRHSSGSAILSLAVELRKPVLCSKIPVFEYYEEMGDFIRLLKLDDVDGFEDVGEAVRQLVSVEAYDWCRTSYKWSMQSYVDYLRAC